MANYGPNIPEDVGERIQRIINRLDQYHHQVRAVEERIIGLQDLADRANLPRVRFAARDAYVKITEMGGHLVQTHLELGRILAPPRTDDDKGERAHE